MEKEEILAKAQKENKGKDLADLEAQRRGANYGFMIGGLTTVAISFINFAITGVYPFGPLAGMLSMVFVAFLTKYIMLRKRHELAVTVIYGILMAMMFTAWILQLCKVI